MQTFKKFINEGWFRHKDGSWSAETSDLDHHVMNNGGKGARCPTCRKPVNHKDFTHHRDREGDITHSTHTHSCGTKLKVWND